MWPNFENLWPLLKNPAPYLFAGAQQIPSAWGAPAVSTLLLLISAAAAIVALIASKKNNRLIPAAGLQVTILLGILFLLIQVHYYLNVIDQNQLTIGSGIYGNLFFMLTGLHTLHVVAGLILFCIVAIRSAAGHFTTDHFAFEAAIWLWSFITVMWLLIYIFLF